MKSGDLIVLEARTWIGTPYALGQCVKGAGVDCARFIHAVLVTCNLMPEEYIEFFAHDWGWHTNEETYVYRLSRRLPKILEGITYPSLAASTGSVVLVKANGARIFNHGGIVTVWPRLIHAAPERVAEINASQHWLWANKTVKIFAPHTEVVSA